MGRTLGLQEEAKKKETKKKTKKAESALPQLKKRGSHPEFGECDPMARGTLKGIKEGEPWGGKRKNVRLENLDLRVIELGHCFRRKREENEWKREKRKNGNLGTRESKKKRSAVRSLSKEKGLVQKKH